MGVHDLKIFFDGGCRPNPGEMEIAVVARGQTYLKTKIGVGDNHEAEWLALLHAIKIGVASGARHVLFLGDSLAVIEEAKGRRSSRRASHHLAALASVADRFERLRFRHIPRSQNLAGTALERLHGRF